MSKTKQPQEIIKCDDRNDMINQISEMINPGVIAANKGIYHKTNCLDRSIKIAMLVYECIAFKGIQYIFKMYKEINVLNNHREVVHVIDELIT